MSYFEVGCVCVWGGGGWRGDTFPELLLFINTSEKCRQYFLSTKETNNISHYFVIVVHIKLYSIAHS